ISEFKQFADAGRIRIIAVTGEERVPGIAVPTLKEAGVDVTSANWRGRVGAPGVADEGRKRWRDRLAQMPESDAWKKVLENQSWEDAYLPGEEFEAFLDEEKARQEEVLKDVGLLK